MKRPSTREWPLLVRVLFWITVAAVVVSALLWVAGTEAQARPQGYDRHYAEVAEQLNHRNYPQALYDRFPGITSPADIDREASTFTKARVKAKAAQTADPWINALLALGTPIQEYDNAGTWGDITLFDGQHCKSVVRTKQGIARIGVVWWTQAQQKACYYANRITARGDLFAQHGLTKNGGWTFWQDRGTEDQGRFVSTFTHKQWISFRFEQEVCLPWIGCLNNLHTARATITLWSYADGSTQTAASVDWH